MNHIVSLEIILSPGVTWESSMPIVEVTNLKSNAVVVQNALSKYKTVLCIPMHIFRLQSVGIGPFSIQTVVPGIFIDATQENSPESSYPVIPFT